MVQRYKYYSLVGVLVVCFRVQRYDGGDWRCLILALFGSFSAEQRYDAGDADVGVSRDLRQSREIDTNTYTFSVSHNTLLDNLQEIPIQCHGCLLHGGFQFVFAQLALPEDYHLPAVLQKDGVVLSVAFTVAGYLRLPERGVALWHPELAATFVSMPETSVDEYSRSVSPHHYVRFAGHAPHIQSVPVSVRPQPPPHRHFRLRRLAAYP